MNRSVSHTGTLRVDAPPEHAFQLFTAPGERLWVDGWDPEVLSGGDGRSKGSVCPLKRNMINCPGLAKA